MNSATRVLCRVAVTSRLIFLVLSFLADVLFPDHESDGFVAPDLVPNSGENVRDRLVRLFFGGLVRWDAQHFLQIARSGYTYQTSFAFFPLFPFVVRSLGFVLQYLLVLNAVPALILASVALNSFLFVQTTIVLYKLSYAVLKHELFAIHSAIFFCLSPATIFFIAPYSESLFAYCAFNGMLSYATNRMYPSILWFTLATFARSNGIVNAGYALHFQWFCIYQLFEQFHSNRFHVFVRTFRRIVFAAASSSLIALPFFLFQLYSYYLLCVRTAVVHHSNEMILFSRAQNVPLVGMPSRVTCNASVTLPYFELQRIYWNVGFLRYYQWKQLPNFLLAAPAISIVLYYGLAFLRENKRLILAPKGLYSSSAPPMTRGLPPKCLVFVVHALYLTVTCALCINVQVTTRLIASSSPVLYWLASSQFVNKDGKVFVLRQFRTTDDIKPSGVVVCTYFMSYAILGTILFSNNLPWT